MVEDRLTDGERIAELLRAEIDGRETAGLDALSIVDADGAMTVRYEGRTLATLDARESGLAIRFRRGGEAVSTAASDRGLDVTSAEWTVVVLASAAETKRAADLLVTVGEQTGGAGDDGTHWVGDS